MSMNNDRKIPFTGMLEIRQLEAIDRLSKQNDEPKSEILRRAVDQYLERREESA